MKKILFLSLLFTMTWLTSCGSDDYFDVEFRNMKLSEVQNKINGTWEVEKTTSGIPGTDNEIDIGKRQEYNLFFDNDKMSFVNPISSMAPEKLPANWEKKETPWGDQAYSFQTSNESGAASAFVIGIHKKMLVVSQAQSGEIINNYYMRVNY